MSETKKVKRRHAHQHLKSRHFIKQFAKFFLLPALVYSVIFFTINPNHLGQFNRSFYLDNGDGYQNVWNIWWVNESITQLDSQPYFTDYVHYPHGVSLAGQTMNIFNGLVGLVLINIFSASLVQATNVAVLLGFIGGGITMFWLLYKLFKRYGPAIIGGALFTFSSYHFAHGLGHLQLISVQFVPLFMLAFLTFMERLRWRDAFYSAGALILVGLCDYYYLFYCLIFAGLLVLFKLYYKELEINWRNFKLLSVFGVATLSVLGAPIYLLLKLTSSGKILGAHDSKAFSMDALSPIIPGGNWRWAEQTEWFWSRLPGYYSETSVFFGFGLLTVLAFTVIKWKKLQPPRWLWFWWGIFVLFAILSLGPRLRAYGYILHAVPLPYAAIEFLFPPFKLSGMPVRMILMTLIAGVIIATFTLTKLDLNLRKARILIVIFIVASIFDVIPKPLPLSSSSVPEYVTKLMQLPPGAIIDNGATSSTEALYYQTVHERKAAFGYISRLPQSVDNKSFHIFADLEQGRYENLCRIHLIRYLITHTDYKDLDYPVLYALPRSKNKATDNLRIYDLKNSDQC